MISNYLKHAFNYPLFPILALILFFGFFLVMLWIVFSKKESYWKEVSLLPLNSKKKKTLKDDI